jgi:hypothetical protein
MQKAVALGAEDAYASPLPLAFTDATLAYQRGLVLEQTGRARRIKGLQSPILSSARLKKMLFFSDLRLNQEERWTIRPFSKHNRSED